MTKHKKKCVCGHLLDVEEVYQKGRADERANTIDEFVKSLFANDVIDKSVVRRVAEQMKGENHV